MKKTKKLTVPQWKQFKVLIGELQETVLKWYGLKLTKGYVKKVVQKTPELKQELLEVKVDAVVREWFASLVAYDIGLSSWPSGENTDEEWEAFKAKLPAALAKRGQKYVKPEDR